MEFFNEKMTSKPEVSIIIPCKNINSHVRECIQHCMNLDYPNYEILLLPDYPVSNAEDQKNSKVIIIPTGSVKPSIKRNNAISRSRGEIIAFLDSDAFPANEDWLKNAVKYFEEDASVGALGGPNLTPKNSSTAEKAGGIILSSRIGAGKVAFRYTIKKGRECDEELMSCNLFVRRYTLKKLDAFDPHLLTAEDSKLCFQIKHNLGKKILYAPDVVVYHHRRPLFIPHLKQIWTYGRDKALLFKKIPEFKKPFYFMPSIFVIGLVVGVFLSLLNHLFRSIYIIAISIYLSAVFISGLRTKNMKMTMLVFIGIILTHITYGIGFLKGLFTRRRLE